MLSAKTYLSYLTFKNRLKLNYTSAAVTLRTGATPADAALNLQRCTNLIAIEATSQYKLTGILIASINSMQWQSANYLGNQGSKLLAHFSLCICFLKVNLKDLTMRLHEMLVVVIAAVPGVSVSCWCRLSTVDVWTRHRASRLRHSVLHRCRHLPSGIRRRDSRFLHRIRRQLLNRLSTYVEPLLL